MIETTPALRRPDLSDETWGLLEPHVPGRGGTWGAWRGITGCLSMRSSEFCVRVRHGGICQPDDGWLE